MRFFSMILTAIFLLSTQPVYAKRIAANEVQPATSEDLNQFDSLIQNSNKNSNNINEEAKQLHKKSEKHRENLLGGRSSGQGTRGDGAHGNGTHGGDGSQGDGQHNTDGNNEDGQN